jgi:hypothetical protein
MLAALIAGERDPKVLAQMARAAFRAAAEISAVSLAASIVAAASVAVCSAAATSFRSSMRSFSPRRWPSGPLGRPSRGTKRPHGSLGGRIGGALAGDAGARM